MSCGYNAKKAAHAAVYFTILAGRRINILKLSKLLYLAERECMSRYDEPMFYDDLYSIKLGPITSKTLDSVNPSVKDNDWDWINRDQNSNYVTLANDLLNLDDLDHLSKADIKIFDDLWAQFKNMDQFALSEYTHVNCPEWKEPDPNAVCKRIPISHEQIFEALGKCDPKGLAREIDAYREFKTQNETIHAILQG